MRQSLLNFPVEYPRLGAWRGKGNLNFCLAKPLSEGILSQSHPGTGAFPTFSVLPCLHPLEHPAALVAGAFPEIQLSLFAGILEGSSQLPFPNSREFSCLWKSSWEELLGVVLPRFYYKCSWIFLRTSLAVKVKPGWFILVLVDSIRNRILGIFCRFRAPCPKQPLH